ncbi:MAG: PhzF family phenazine biosynthesis protein [Candidatus Bathyarchaeota archaeon]|nr:PhzF family phenazine biosynthesis protein [Candidatus Bathyarchaeota archaeon]
MMKLPYHIVDVFAENKLEGNQLAVVMDEQGISGALMQKIALEMNFSETTFITAVDNEKLVYKVRIFTKESELPFAGHPTLGTAYVIQQNVIGKPVKKLTLDLKAGMIPVTFNYTDNKPSILWMKQLDPVFGKTHDPKAIVEFLGLNPEDIDTDYPIQEVSTGVYFFMIPVKTSDAVKRVKLDTDKLKEYTNDTDAKWPLIFCREPEKPENHIKCRMITTFGEDPATGSANGCLAGYLVKHRYFGEPEIDVRVEQGAEMNRPSILYLKAKEMGEEIEVNVGGKVVAVAEGHLV